MEWHDLTKNKNDLPKVSNHYEVVVIRTDGVKRVYNNVFYRVKAVKEYYKVGNVTRSRIKEAGWKFSKNGKVDHVLAWREKTEDEFLKGLNG